MLTDNDLEMISTVHAAGEQLADESITRLIDQAREANRLRAALKEALDSWWSLADSELDSGAIEIHAREIAALRKLAEPAPS